LKGRRRRRRRVPRLTRRKLEWKRAASSSSAVGNTPSSFQREGKGMFRRQRALQDMCESEEGKEVVEGEGRRGGREGI